MAFEFSTLASKDHGNNVKSGANNNTSQQQCLLFSAPFTSTPSPTLSPSYPLVDLAHRFDSREGLWTEEEAEDEGEEGEEDHEKEEFSFQQSPPSPLVKPGEMYSNRKRKKPTRTAVPSRGGKSNTGSNGRRGKNMVRLARLLNRLGANCALLDLHAGASESDSDGGSTPPLVVYMSDGIAKIQTAEEARKERRRRLRF